MIKEKIEKIFDDNDLKNYKYNLHSVCVHEGSAALGHFWTYIWNKAQQKWYKFNDTEVCESNWDDLYVNAVGGVTSAYFLIYVNANDEYLYQGIQNLIIQFKLGCHALFYLDADDLSKDLKCLIDDDQNLLNIQLTQLKLKQTLKILQERLKKQPQVPVVSNEIHQTCIEHARAFNESTMESFQASFEKLLTDGPDEAFKYALVIELNKYVETARDVLARLPDCDLRTNHILSYLSANNAPKESREIAAMDIFRIQIFSDNDIRIKILQAIAQIMYNETFCDPGKQEFVKQYEKLQSDYRDYRSIIAAFITACTHLEVEKYCCSSANLH